MLKMRKYVKYLVIPLLMIGCVGTDIVEDFVEPNIVIENALLSIKVGDTHKFSPKYFDNLGNEEEVSINWSSSDPAILSITNDGLATANMRGTVDITAESEDAMIVFSLEIGDETVAVEEERTTELRTVGSYELSGTATLKKEDGKLVLSFASNFRADSGLPGLFVYLANSTNTINNALEVSPITKFTGEQSFNITGTDDLFKYNIVLFYCKPFVVPVGNGTLTP